jgi:hypothetical protein
MIIRKFKVKPQLNNPFPIIPYFTSSDYYRDCLLFYHSYDDLIHFNLLNLSLSFIFFCFKCFEFVSLVFL